MAPARPWIRTLAETRVSRRFAVLLVLAAVAVSTAVGSAMQVAALLAAAEGHEANPIAISSDRLEFGDVPFHGEVVRHLVLRNDGDGPVRAWFFASGSGYRVDPRDMMLDPGVETSVAITVTADKPGLIWGELLVHVDDGGGPLVIRLAARSAGAGESDGRVPVPELHARGPASRPPEV